MVKYCMNLSDEKKETAIKIALESKGNVRKRKIAVPLLMILGIVIIFSSIFLIINSVLKLLMVCLKNNSSDENCHNVSTKNSRITPSLFISFINFFLPVPISGS